MKLKYQWPLVWSLLFLTYFREALALPAVNGTLWQHLLWPLVHANILHWFLNTIGFMALWRLVTVTRLIWGYAASIAIGYLWTASSAVCGSDTDVRLCGLSCIIFFLIGIIFARLRNRYRIRLAILIAVSCFIPGIAAIVHIASLLAGILFACLSRHIRTTRPISPIIYD